MNDNKQNNDKLSTEQNNNSDDFIIEKESMTVKKSDNEKKDNPDTENSECNSPKTKSKDKAENSSCMWNNLPPCQFLQNLQKRPFRKRHPIIFWGGLIILLLIAINAIINVFSDNMGALGSKRLAVVRVEGMILNTESTLKWIDEIYKDDSVKGVLLRIDSPGGGAAASYELYEAIAWLAKKKPVLAYMGTIAASGGLMIAMGAPQIIANPSAITGSIGVKMSIPQLQGLMGKLGIGQETLTTGRFKDAASPYKPLTDAERKYLQAILDDMHSQFVEMVAKSRKLPLDKVKELADGRIFTGRSAKELGIVDELGSWEYAIQKLAMQVAVDKNSTLLEEPSKDSFYTEFLKSIWELDHNVQRSVNFMYIY